MTQVLSSSPPSLSLSLPAFAAFSLEAPATSTSRQTGSTDAQLGSTSAHSTPNSRAGGLSAASSISAASAGVTGGPVSRGTPNTSSIHAPLAEVQAKTNTTPAMDGQQQLLPQMYIADSSSSRSPSPMLAAPSSNNSAASSRSGTPVNGTGAHYRSQHAQQSSLNQKYPNQRAPSPSPSTSYNSPHLISQQHSPHQGGARGAPLPNMTPSHSPSHQHPSSDAANQVAMMQAAYQQQQQHFQSQMASMLAAGLSQHQVSQLFQQQQMQHPYTPQIPPMMVGDHHDPRRRAPSLPNTSNGGGLIQNAGYFPAQQQQQHYPQFPQGQPFHHMQSTQQPFYHPQYTPQYPQQPHHIQPHHHPQFSPYTSPQPILASPAGSMRGSPGSSMHSASPGRERAPTAPSSLPSSPMSSNGGSASSPGSGRAAPTGAVPPFAMNARPASPGGVADLARRRAESQPNDNRIPLAPTIATQPQYAPSPRDRTGSTSSETRKPIFNNQNFQARPVPPPSSISQTPQRGSTAADLVALPRIRTDSGISSSSASSGSQGVSGSSATAKGGISANRPASPASTTSDRAPTPTQALHSQLTGSSTNLRSGRTTPIASSNSGSSSPATQQQQQLGLQPSIKLTNGTPDSHGHNAGPGIIRKASPLSQQSTYSDGHRSITPTQASAGFAGQQSLEHDSDAETEEIASQQPTAAGVTTSKHRATLSNASSTMSSSSPQTPSSGKSGSTSSLFRNKLRKAMSLSELNNSSSTLSSGDASSSSKKLGRTSLTSNSSSSDTSHSTAEPRTPPNGAPPVLPRGFATASASNLHSGSTAVNEHGVPQNGRATPNNGNSLPSNAGRRFGILNSKMNSSTDNISISSTVSSASMMLRKMGNFGKLARKSSVRSLSNLFHRDKHDNEGGDNGSVGTTGRKVTSDAVSEFGVPGAAMTSSKDRKKGSLADPSVAHVTVELERGEAAAAAKAGMTPAEALVRKHQERERLQRVEQEKAVRARTASSSSSIAPSSASQSQKQDLPSPRSKLLEKEKERLKTQNAGKKSLGKKFSFGAFSRTASSSSLRQEALHASTNGSIQSSEDKDSPRSSSSSSSANASPIFDSSTTTSSSSASPVILQHELDTRQFSKPLDIDFRPSLDGVQLDTWRNGPAAISSGISLHPLERGLHVEDEENDEGFDDRTPRQSMELIGDQSTSSTSTNAGNYSDWDGEPPNTASFFDDDTASFKDGSEHTARSIASNAAPFNLQDPEDYSSDSGADGRNGQAIPKRPPPHARPAKGILKNARSYSQEQLRGPQPAFASRPRASSYDAPHQTTAPNQPGKVATLAQYIPSGAELDGVAAHPSSAPRLDTRVSSPTEIEYANTKEVLSPSSSSSFSPGTSPYNHPNTSEPILSNMKSIHMTTRSVTGPIVKRNISFAQNLSVHTTWSGSTYDRRGDSATCNRLTPQLAQRIKEELNAFKMEEMEVHYQSRNYTHFFV